MGVGEDMESNTVAVSACPLWTGQALRLFRVPVPLNQALFTTLLHSILLIVPERLIMSLE